MNRENPLLSTLKRKEVRDLAWTWESPSLLSESSRVVSDSENQRFSNSLREWFLGLDQNPSPLQKFLKETPASPRLGHYFESLVLFGLKHFPEITKLKHRIPLTLEKKTLGEFDFLFYDENQKKGFHWETAVKFYLYDPSEKISDLSQFWGPGGKDRLDLKYDRIFKHQLPLSQKSEALKLFQLYGFSSIESRTFVKGRLFYPIESDWNTHPHPSEVSSHHLRGWWTYWDSLVLPESSDSKWIFLERNQWIGKVLLPKTTKTPLWDQKTLKNQITRHFENSYESIMIAELQETEKGWEECSRGMVVSKRWPKLPI